MRGLRRRDTNGAGATDTSVAAGIVSLVGAGPGDPDLLTCRAAQRLAEADLVLHDGLVTADVLDLAMTAERVCVSRRPGAKAISQVMVTQRMIDEARAGRRVVRLKAGDPFVLGRGGEEALALAEARVPFEVVPGLTSAVAAPAVAGIPVTHRGLASGFVVVSGHAPDAYAPILGHLAPAGMTLVVLMGFAERGRIAARLIDLGWSPTTPAALISNATQAGQRIWTGPLAAMGQALRDASPEDAHTIVVGEVVSLGAAIGAAAGPRRAGRVPWAAAAETGAKDRVRVR